AALGILGVEIVVARRQRALDQSLAARSLDVPPALGNPAGLGAIADRHADQILGGVAYAEIGACRRRRGQPEQPGKSERDWQSRETVTRCRRRRTHRRTLDPRSWHDCRPLFGKLSVRVNAARRDVLID